MPKQMQYRFAVNFGTLSTELTPKRKPDSLQSLWAGTEHLQHIHYTYIDLFISPPHAAATNRKCELGITMEIIYYINAIYIIDTYIYICIYIYIYIMNLC